MSELAIIREFDIFVPTLLLCLPNLNPLLHCEVFVKLGKFVVMKAQTVKQWTIADRVQNNLVVWPGAKYTVSLLLHPRTQVL